LAVWEADTTLANHSDLTADYASAWQAAGQGRLLLDPGRTTHREDAARTPLLPSAVRGLKAAAERDLLIGGPNLAAQAVVAGLVDELALFVWPVVLGGRTPALATDTRADLTLIDEHRFSNGVVHLRYRLR
jgi:riboflavin biosynthesis pyrimidine reductase